jgi:hypothetical protein
MKKIFTLLAVAAMSAAASTVSADTWAMPGTYQGWKLETNQFSEVNGVLTQTIADLYGDFKVVRFDGAASWDHQWCSNGDKVENNVAYVAPAADNGSNIMMAGDNFHYINATVTITPGATDSDPITILVSAERVETGEETWQLVGSDPLAWDFTTAPKFTKGDNGVWTLAYTGEISGEFKVAQNGAWANSYSTAGAISLNETYTLTGPQDPIDNMSPADGPWSNPTFTLTVGDTVTLTVTTEAGVTAVAADDVNAPAVYYNLQGVRVNNPENGLYIRVQGNKATKVAL